MLLFYTDGLIDAATPSSTWGSTSSGGFPGAPGSVDQVADVVCEVMLRDSSREDDAGLGVPVDVGPRRGRRRTARANAR